MKLVYAIIKKSIFCLIVCMSPTGIYGQQSKLKIFKLEDGKLEEEPFRNAMLVDMDYILALNPDKLLAPFLREDGLTPKEGSYASWENSGLDGHIDGYYLTALAQMQVSAGSEEPDVLLTYSLKELKRVQEANGNGYIGGVPGSKELLDEIAQGPINAAGFSLNEKWVPLYNIHKTYSGLRDAYQISGNLQAKEMLIEFTDWMLGVTENLTEKQLQHLLVCEHEGLNEIFVDVTEISGDEKYLELAYKFLHEELLSPFFSNNNILSGMHANTKIPKMIGFPRIVSLDGNEEYHGVATTFWENVVNERSVAIGGNSVREHFHPITDFSEMTSSEQEPVIRIIC